MLLYPVDGILVEIRRKWVPAVVILGLISLSAKYCRCYCFWQDLIQTLRIGRDPGQLRISPEAVREGPRGAHCPRGGKSEVRRHRICSRTAARCAGRLPKGFGISRRHQRGECAGYPRDANLAA